MKPTAPAPLRFVLVTMDPHLQGAAERARGTLQRQMPGLRFTMHAASEWANDAQALQHCKDDIARADIVVVTMLFMEEHFKPILDDLAARRDHCDAMVCAMSAGEVARLTRMGKFDMAKPASGILALLKKLRGKSGAEQAKDGQPPSASSGERQMKMLRRLPQLLKFIPGTAQDVRAYFLTLQYWLGGSQDNVVNLVRFLVDRYAGAAAQNQGSQARTALRGHTNADAPVEYPEVGVYHPRLPGRMSGELAALPQLVKDDRAQGRVGLLLLRSYLLAGNARHYDAVIAALEVQGLQVVPAFASGLDSRPAIERFFMKDGRATVDAVLSLTGFSLVGGPAYNDSHAAETILAQLDVPYVAAHSVEFQSLSEWGGSARGLLPVEATIMVAIPELDGATGPSVYGGRAGAAGSTCTGCEKACHFPEADTDMHSCSERTAMLASRIARLVALRRKQRADRRVALVVFNFPPNAGNLGTAAYLSVFESVFETLKGLQREGYTVEMPASVDALRVALLEGNRERLGADANVLAQIPAADHVKRERWLKEIEAAWGPAPGRQLSDGRAIFVLGVAFGNVVLTVQPGMGYEGDPMRLLFEKGFAPTHAFSAFYRWLREDWKADAVLHFGTHGSLEFMPGKQAGLTGSCWPDRLIRDLPNFYLYASNNPSEGAIAKRRAAATLISYLTPPVAEAGLYRGLLDLKSSLTRWRGRDADADGANGHEKAALATLIQAQAAELELAALEPAWSAEQAEAEVMRLTDAVLELEYTLIPHGLHVVGRAPKPAERASLLWAICEADNRAGLSRECVEAIAQGDTPEQALRSAGRPANADALAALAQLARHDRLMAEDTEIAGIVRALDGRFVPPAPGGDVMRNPEVLPTGRNLHGFDPFRIPSAFAVRDATRQADKLLARHALDGHGVPETVALVLWGTDNLKSEGAPLAQALALMGAAPRFDGYGRLAGATLIPLEQLGRPRVDVLMTLSGIFRDLLPLQIRMLAEAAFLCASADEPEAQNFIRKHALAWQREHGGSLETASLRVFGNADGAYGSNVNLLVDSSTWQDEDELAEAYTKRKGFAYGRSGKPVAQARLLNHVLADVALSYQNLDSVELGVTTVDTYFDTLGGISRAVKRAKVAAGATGAAAETPVYIADQTRSAEAGTVRTLAEQVALETRTRMLNPKWYEGMLEHGYEGVRQIEVSITNTFAWSATTGQVAPWVYQHLTETFVLDPAMRERLAKLNPTASAKVAHRLLEACDRQYWTPDAATLEALKRAGEELEDRLEGVFEGSLVGSPLSSHQKAAA